MENDFGLGDSMITLESFMKGGSYQIPIEGLIAVFMEELTTSYPNRCNKNMIGKTTGNTANSQDLIDKRQYF